jgi:hypothetical protein
LTGIEHKHHPGTTVYADFARYAPLFAFRVERNESVDNFEPGQIVAHNRGDLKTKDGT